MMPIPPSFPLLPDSTLFQSCSVILLAASPPARADDPIPHAQDKPPGPALSPMEAMAKMRLPPGFAVQLVAAEPDVVNPTDRKSTRLNSSHANMSYAVFCLEK